MDTAEQCPDCRAAVLPGAKYCGRCGRKLETICPSCASGNPSHFRFCGECGRSLTPPTETIVPGLPPPGPLARMEPYFPAGLTPKILAHNSKIEGERRRITAMFCDLQGFTSLCEKIGPEEAYSLMDRIYELLIHCVDKYEGTVNKMTGDGIMALFGAPVAREDAPRKAILASLDIHREMAEFSRRLRRADAGASELKMRIGIHSGPVVMGTVGNEIRVEFTAYGDTINLASRMEGLAAPGTTYVTEEIFNHTRGFFRFKPMGEVTVKGRRQPVKTYRVVARSGHRTRLDVLSERGLSPFVGRERESELLLDCLDRARSGQGQAVSIVSEAGLGKSRLLLEFKRTACNGNVDFLEGRCFSYCRGTPYHLVTEVLRSAFGIRSSDSKRAVDEKITKGLSLLRLDTGAARPLLLDLLSTRRAPFNALAMSREAQKETILSTLHHLVALSSRNTPLVIAMEDLHWIDKGSEDVLAYLVENIPALPVLLVFTCRPQWSPPWGKKTYHHRIGLNRLSDGEVRFLANSLFEGCGLDEDIHELILKKAEGVPFFVEEFVKMLLDLGIVRKEHGCFRLVAESNQRTIPSTLQEMIMARVDTLSEEARTVLQVGAAIEREFSYPLLLRLTNMEEDTLRTNLNLLKEGEFVYERGVFPRSTFVFKHRLMQEVVYDSLLTDRKRKLHGEIGSALEELYGNLVEEQSELLARHYMAAGNYTKAADYSELAAKKAEKTASLRDVIYHKKNLVECREKLQPCGENLRGVIDARTSLGLFQYLMGNIAEARESVEPVFRRAVKLRLKPRLSQIHTIMGAYACMVEENFASSLHHLRRALSLSEETRDIVSLLFANYLLGLSLSWTCDFDRASHYLQKGLDIVTAMRIPWSISVLKTSLSMYAHCNRGDVAKGFSISEEALSLAQESGDVYSKALGFCGHGISLYCRGDLEEARDHLRKGVEFNERINLVSFAAVSNQWLGHACHSLGRYDEAARHYSGAIYHRERSGLFPSSIEILSLFLARSQVAAGMDHADVAPLAARAGSGKIPLYWGQMHRTMAEILIALGEGDSPEAEGRAARALKSHEADGMQWEAAMDLVCLGKTARCRGNREEERGYLRKACALFNACGAPKWAQRYESGAEDDREKRTRPKAAGKMHRPVSSGTGVQSP